MYAVCSISSEKSRRHSKQYDNIPPARAQEHKAQLHAQFIVPLVYIHYSFVVGTPCSFEVYTGFPLPTHKTQQANSLQQGGIYTKYVCTKHIKYQVPVPDISISAATTGPLLVSTEYNILLPAVMLLVLLLFS